MINPYHFLTHHPDVEFVQNQLCYSKQRLSVAHSDVAFYQKQTERWRSASKSAIHNALFDLMNSGISHRRFLKVVQLFEVKHDRD